MQKLLKSVVHSVNPKYIQRLDQYLWLNLRVNVN